MRLCNHFQVHQDCEVLHGCDHLHGKNMNVNQQNFMNKFVELRHSYLPTSETSLLNIVREHAENKLNMNFTLQDGVA